MTVTIHKLNHEDRETWRYAGEIVERGATWVKVEAYFDREDHQSDYVFWRKGDRFIEWFFTDHWYNVFEIHDVSDDHLKGYYCNITRPAQIETTDISWFDLELDVWIYPSGETRLLDVAELAESPLEEALKDRIWDAVEELHTRLEQRESPFDQIP